MTRRDLRLASDQRSVADVSVSAGLPDVALAGFSTGAPAAALATWT